MYKTKKILISLMLMTIISLSFFGAYNLPADTPIALIKKIVQDVSYKGAGMDDWEEAKVGIPLNDGEEVRTGFRSLALILFTDGSGILRVRENSILHIYGEEEDRKIDKNTFIEKGKINFEVSKQEDEEFKFTTPTVVASIRGTNGNIDVRDDSTTAVSVGRGLIELAATMGSRSSGTVSGGNTAIIDTRGNIEVRASTEIETNDIKKSSQVETKVLKIRTNDGTIEIEFLPPEE